MGRKLLHISILLSLGLYYNGAPALWLAYSTFAKAFFVEHCENPTKPCCQGKCQVKKFEAHSASSNESSVQIQYSAPQPAIIATFELDPLYPKNDRKVFPETLQTDHFFSLSPFHPPRV